jgi:hypothetical protein
MRRRIITLASAALLALAVAAPASAHPVNPPGNEKGNVAFAGGSSPAHTKGLACASYKSQAIVVLPALDCTIGWGR